MSKRETLIKVLALAGTLFAWLPLLAPVFFSLVRLIQRGRLLFDYLMPAELFLLGLLGGGALFWSALQVRRYHRAIAWSMFAQLFACFASQGVAVITGLASGATEPSGPAWLAVNALLVLFILANLATAVFGLLLLRSLFKPSLEPIS